MVKDKVITTCQDLRSGCTSLNRPYLKFDVLMLRRIWMGYPYTVHTLVDRCGFFGVAKVRINISGFLFIMEGKYPHFFPVVEANWSFFYVAEGIGFLYTYVG
jgi:hypothetical protein